MLIGVLAQVETAVAPFVKPAGPEGGDDDKVGPVPAQQARASIVAGRGGDAVAPQVGGGLDAGQDDDMGVAISRDELGDDDEDEADEVPSGPQRSSPPPKPTPMKEKRQDRSGGSKGKKRSRADDAGSSRIGKPEKPNQPDPSRDEKKVKKKKKKKGGDEFDDLFSSLM